ncbi:MAG: hypothetical protein NTW49_14495 [Bacteroidia bacterium]|nr:hypothetical protein [Bacteroidia bacterium]
MHIKFRTDFLTCIFCLIIGCVSSQEVHAQYRQMDSLAMLIPESITHDPATFAGYLKSNFQTDQEIARVLYVWLANTINYDVAKMSNPGTYANSNELIMETLKSRQGVCQNYSEVFTGILKLLNFKVFTVSGYARSDNKTDTKTGHAWNVAMIADKWYIFDATWGAGYLNNNGYHKKFTDRFFMAGADSMIKYHMPFDPIWQLLDYPVKHDEFFKGITKGSIYMNFNDSIELYASQSALQRAEGSLRRADSYHFTIPELHGLRQRILNYVENERLSYSYDIYNTATLAYNASAVAFNSYGKNRNNKNLTAEAKLNQLLSIEKQLADCTDDLNKIRTTDAKLTGLIRELKTKIRNLNKMISVQKKAVKR